MTENEHHTGGWRGWLRLGLAVLLIWAFVLALPLLERIPVVATLHEHIRSRDIEAGALFYSEADESAEAEQYMRHVLSD